MDLVSLLFFVALVFLCCWVRNKINDWQQQKSMEYGIMYFEKQNQTRHEVVPDGAGADEIPIEWFMWSDL